MLKIIIFVIIGFILFKLIMGDRKKKMADKAKKNENQVQSGEMVKDPICGTYVPSDNDIRIKKGNKVYHFCSYECRDAFLEKLKEDK